MDTIVNELVTLLEEQDEGKLREMFKHDIWDLFSEMESITWKQGRGIEREEQIRRIARALLVLIGKA